jgi:hemolysin (HlyC) family protein
VHTSDKQPWYSKLRQLLLQTPNTAAQLVQLLRDAEQKQLLDADALAMIEGVLQVTEMQVRDIMIPRSQMVVVADQEAITDFLPLLINSSHSRFPVIGDDKDEIMGILHAKDLLSYTVAENKTFELKDILRPAIVIPESKRLNVLLKEFRSKRNHMAIVVDEYGGVSGLITIEDVLEQIVGNIEDEFDIEETSFIKKHSSTHFTLKALTPIADFNQYFQSQLNESDYDTIGGLIMHEFGHMPKRGETIDLNNLHFEVLHADNRQIHLLSLSPAAAEPLTAVLQVNER